MPERSRFSGCLDEISVAVGGRVVSERSRRRLKSYVDPPRLPGRMLPEERRRRIAERIDETGRATVDELIETFDCSRSTVYRDLHALEDRNLVERTRGGAVSPADRGTEYDQRKVRRREQKRAIAARAVEELSDDRIVCFDSGSTTLAISRQIDEDAQFDVVTNSTLIAHELGSTGAAVHLTGGTLRFEHRTLHGPGAERYLDRWNLELLFLGADGVTADKGLMTRSTQQASIKRSMVTNAQRTVLVIDHAKFERSSTVQFGEFNEIDMIVTDKEIPDPIHEELLGSDVTVVDECDTN